MADDPTGLRILVDELIYSYAEPTIRQDVLDATGRKVGSVDYDPPPHLARRSLFTRIADTLEPGNEGNGGGRTVLSHSPFPGRAWAQGWLTDIHGDARHHEAVLLHLLHGVTRPRPGSDWHTFEALRRLPTHIAGARDRYPDDRVALAIANNAERAIASLNRRALIALGFLRPWQRVRGLVCGACGNESLRVRPSDQAYVCALPACRNVYETTAEVREHLGEATG